MHKQFTNNHGAKNQAGYLLGVGTIMILSLFLLAGCLDYKKYDVPKENPSQDDAALLDEIAQIEQELNVDGSTGAVVVEEPVAEEQEDIGVVEEVVLPELTEEDVVSDELQVITVKENELIKLQTQVVDPDQDTVTSTFGKPLNSLGEWQTNYGDAGEYVTTITATDGVHTTKKDVKIIVERVNVPPQIAAVRDLIVKEGETVKFTPQVTDPNKDEVTITVSEPLALGTFLTDHTSAGEYDVQVLATDGELESRASFKLVVTDVNVLPEISGVEDITVKEGETVLVQPQVSDLDGDDVQVTISEPVGNDGEWETDYTNHGEYFIIVTADDGKDKVTKRLRLLVQDVNKAPEIVDIRLAR